MSVQTFLLQVKKTKWNCKDKKKRKKKRALSIRKAATDFKDLTNLSARVKLDLMQDLTSDWQKIQGDFLE